MITEGGDYDLLDECESIAVNREQERSDFLDATVYQVSRAVVEGDINLEEANHAMEQIGEKYPLSLEEMAMMINRVHTANHLGSVEEPGETSTDAKEWSTLLARLNPKYTIFTDKDGDVSLGLTEQE